VALRTRNAGTSIVWNGGNYGLTVVRFVWTGEKFGATFDCMIELSYELIGVT
jgi:hypothetical protein